jgi:hypothetical protein
LSLASLALWEKICKIPFMKKASIQFLYVTFPNQKIAKKISQMLIKQKLIACANILPKMTSLSQESILFLTLNHGTENHGTNSRLPQ